MSDILTLFGERVRLIRKEKNLTQEQFAEKCGLQNTYIGGVERGERNISIQTIEKIAIGLNVTPYELFKFDSLSLTDDYLEKSKLIQLYSNILLNRDEKELRLLHKVTKEILDYLDSN